MHSTFLEIRILTAAARDNQMTEALDQRRQRPDEIADICHYLTSWLGLTAATA